MYRRDFTTLKAKDQEKALRKQREAAEKRWAEMTEEEKREYASEISVAMKKYWATKTQEERSAVGRKAAETRKKNQAAKLEAKRKERLNGN